ncbi:MAG: putative glycoside hydrolase [Alkalispirochaeta sp.]
MTRHRTVPEVPPVATAMLFLLIVLLPLSVEGSEAPSLQVEPVALLLPGGDGGELVENPALREATGPNTYLTAAAVAPWDRSRIVVATTFHGIFESRDGGRSWIDLGETGEIAALYQGDGFYEDISAVAYDPRDRDALWVESAQTGVIDRIDRRTGTFVATAGTTPVETGRRAIAASVRAPQPEFPVLDDAARERRRRAADHVSFYLSPWQMEPEVLEQHMAFAEEHGFTAVVIDFKDDFGRIAYNSELSFHNEIGAVRSYFDARRVIDTVHEHGLYLIARVVVFKDRELAEYDDGRYSVWDGRRSVPWGVFREESDPESGEPFVRQVEHWVDPFSEFVWDYNIEIATELERLGVDEVQFDYIRTPSDGLTRDIEYRFRADSPALVENDPFRDDRVEALSMFLSRAREAISIPLGVDVFGFNGWYRMSYLGQDIALLARYVDVISPMLYPSHFPREFRGDLGYLDWAEMIYREGVARGRRITEDHVLIRPYVQSFLIGGELDFETPYYTEYLQRQIKGTLDAGGSGFTLWNFSGRYYMVEGGLWLPGVLRSEPSRTGVSVPGPGRTRRTS